MKYSTSEIESFRHEVLVESFCILPDHFPQEKMKVWMNHFAPLLEDHIQREGKVQNRGTGRFYITLPFDTPFSDESVFCDPDILAIVEELVGTDFTMVQLASDTPLKGSEYQEIHRDAPPLFPGWERETPPFQLAVNFPLVDVTLDNGPFEVARRTHTVSKAEGLRMIETGEAPLEAVCLKLGDVMIRDVRHLHRGTPNLTEEPRPMVVIGYSRKWHFRPEVSIRIPLRVWAALSERSRNMLRFNPVVESLEKDPGEEEYRSFAY